MVGCKSMQNNLNKHTHACTKIVTQVSFTEQYHMTMITYAGVIDCPQNFIYDFALDCPRYQSL